MALALDAFHACDVKHICNDKVIARGTSLLPVQSARMLCKREPAGSVIGGALWVSALHIPQPGRQLTWRVMMVTARIDSNRAFLPGACISLLSIQCAVAPVGMPDMLWLRAI